MSLADGVPFRKMKQGLKIPESEFVHMSTIRTLRGRPHPLGVSAAAEGLNFALLCRHGTSVWLLVYHLDDLSAEPITEIRLHPRFNRTGDHWHVLVSGLPN